MKTLPPTLREDHRYIKIQLSDERKDSFDQTVQKIKKIVKRYAGERGLAQIEPWLIREEFDKEELQAVVKINRGFEEAFRAALVTSEEKIYTIETSGTLESIRS